VRILSDIPCKNQQMSDGLEGTETLLTLTKPLSVRLTEW